MRRFRLAIVNCILIAALVLASGGAALAQEGGEDAFIATLFPRMSPDVKIGQLFIVAFDGVDTSDASEIRELILNYHVGGVVLSPGRGNVVDAGNGTPEQVVRLTSALQSLAKESSTLPRPDAQPVPFIPLFIALNQDGGGPAYSAITGGLTPQPSPMALGATWSTDDAHAVGQIVGTELSALGINFLLGPSLDVLTKPDADGGDAGVRSFGGDPYWVGALAGAFVRGLRAGSAGRIAVTLKSFPGEGGLYSGSDTIDASLDQLQRIDLQPYFTLMQTPDGQTRPLTSGAPITRSLADAALTTHARFRGFRDLRSSTGPVSVDASALGALLNLEPVASWRNSGGLTVSGALGADALDAFLAGNDVLILNDFPNGDRQRVITSTIETFRQRYSADLSFQDRVDSAVKRILRLKYRLYPSQRDFLLPDVLATPEGLDARLQQNLPAVERVAQDALTRVYPGPEVPQSSLPTPATDDTFLVFTDDHLQTDCTGCPERTTLFTTAISQTLTRLADVPPEQITSFGFAELRAFANRTPGTQDLASEFTRADWVILAQQNLDVGVQQSDAARLLLRNQADLLAGKRVVLFSFGPPYQLTADDLKPVQAYYALYGATTPSVEAAVRAWFGQIQPAGASPVSLEAVGYDLTTRTEPDPAQTIQLFVGEEPGPSTPTPAPPSLGVDDDVLFRTGQILDGNGHPVPDGTPVQFTLVYRDAENVTEQIEVMTADGSADIVTRIRYTGLLEVTAISEPALNSVTLQLTIANDNSVTIVETLAPPPTRTPTRSPTVTRTPTRTLTPTPTPIDPLIPLLGLGGPPRWATLIDFVVSMLGIVLLEAWGYRREARRRGEEAIERAVRLVLWGALCGLVAYTGYALGFPGAEAVRAALGNWAAPVVTLIGAAAPWLVDWFRRRAKNA